jgi:hypothetical protein
MPLYLRTELEQLEDQRRALKERERQLLATCDKLAEEIREVRDRVKDSGEAHEEKSAAE